jgi:predicted molibdopterin-dependent oxidoreductase YjgC
MTARFRRLTETDRPRVSLTIDGAAITALEGDSLMVAILTSGDALRDSEFGDGRRAGFCLMAACQDCWVWTASGDRLRACSTPVQPGMAISTHQPSATWATQP